MAHTPKDAARRTAAVLRQPTLAAFVRGRCRARFLVVGNNDRKMTALATQKKIAAERCGLLEGVTCKR